MNTANLTEFRKHAAAFLDVVETGEVVRIFKHGKAIADISPVHVEDKPSWIKAPPQLPLSGVSLSEAILQSRKDPVR